MDSIRKFDATRPADAEEVLISDELRSIKMKINVILDILDKYNLCTSVCFNEERKE